MPFGRDKELTKDDLIKAGLNPDDLAELKANGVKKADLETLKTELATSVTEMIKNQFTELETKLAPRLVNKGGNNGNNDNMDGNNNNNIEDDNVAFLSDPVGFLNKKVGQGVMYTAISTTKMRMDLAMDRARVTLKGFKNEALKKEIEEEWAQYKPEVFAANKDFDPDKLILKIHNMVIGNHMDDIQRDADKKDGKFNIVASSSGGGGGNNMNTDHSNDGKKPEDMLTDVEKAQAAKYGMTPKEWADQQKEMADEEQKVMAQK